MYYENFNCTKITERIWSGLVEPDTDNASEYRTYISLLSSSGWGSAGSNMLLAGLISTTPTLVTGTHTVVIISGALAEAT